jgi:thiamine pyrophosphokinase
MHAVVVGASPEPQGRSFYRALLDAADLVVAADAGAEWCVGIGHAPYLAVGDFDSSEPGAQTRLRALGVRVEEHPAAKDRSDLDLAITAAMAAGATSLTLTACSGRRLDHTIAALGSLLRASAADVADWQEPTFAGWAFEAPSRSGVALSVEPGTMVSVFAIGTASGVTVRGGRFALQDATLDPLSSRGLSNVASGPRFSVSARHGCVVVIVDIAGAGPRPMLIPAQ